MTGNSSDTFSKRVAGMVSVVFNPIFIPLYGLAILFSAPTFLSHIPFKVKKILFIVVLLNNVLVPLSLFPFFRSRNIISSFAVEERTERIIPLSVIAILYFITSYIYLRFPVPELIKSFIIAASVLVVLLTLINFWWKISIHTAGAGALAGLVMVLGVSTGTALTGYLVAVILASGLTLFARLKLNAHTPGQVWAGFFTGFAVSGLLIWLL